MEQLQPARGRAELIRDSTAPVRSPQLAISVYDVRDTFADPTRIKEAFGWEPKVKLREGLEREVAFLRELYA